jgi:sulfatase modifying factor 1
LEKSNYIESINDISFGMIFIKGGTYLMGSEKYNDEQPIHEVKVPDFYLSKYLVTQELWMAVMGVENNPSYFKGKKRPVERVSWDDAQEFLKKLNKLAAHEYVLPTESCWEYAARGGRHRKGFRYAGSNKLKEVAWYDKNSHAETKPVGLKAPNALGLYDMSGNVWEWCQDVWHDNYEQAPTNGSAWMTGGEEDRRVVRGGSWDIDFEDLFRVSDRGRFDHNFRYVGTGYRLSRYC